MSLFFLATCNKEFKDYYCFGSKFGMIWDFSIYDVGLLVLFIITMLSMFFGFGGKKDNEDENVTDVSKTFLRIVKLSTPDWPLFVVIILLDIIELTCELLAPLLLERIINEFTSTIGNHKAPAELSQIFSSKLNSALALLVSVGIVNSLTNYANRKVGQLAVNNTWKRAQVPSHLDTFSHEYAESQVYDNVTKTRATTSPTY